MRCPMHDSIPKTGDWSDHEVDIEAFCDKRLGKRLRSLVAQLAGAVGGPIPMACQDWANTKAAYRFLSNGTVDEAEILAGHFQATRSRAAAIDDLDERVIAGLRNRCPGPAFELDVPNDGIASQLPGECEGSRDKGVELQETERCCGGRIVDRFDERAGVCWIRSQSR